MIETPARALVADSIGKQAEFFSFGTNDLTQMTMGFSRDDAGKFLPAYLKLGMYEQDPFRSIDQKGVGLLVQMAVQKGRPCARTSRSASAANTAATRPRWLLPPAGLDYVSCSPFRVPIAVVIDQLAHGIERVQHAGAGVALVFKLQAHPTGSPEKLGNPNHMPAHAKACCVAQYRQCTGTYLGQAQAAEHQGQRRQANAATVGGRLKKIADLVHALAVTAVCMRLLVSPNVL
jgi:hypothetical protein